MTFFKQYIYTLSRAIWLLLKPLSIGVRILLVRDDKILLVKHVYQSEWYLPGGLVDHGETLEEAIRREAAEEVGADIRDLSLFGAYTNFLAGNTDHIVVFFADDFSVNGKMDAEIERWGFFDLQSLPKKISSGSKNRIQEYLRNESPTSGKW